MRLVQEIKNSPIKINLSNDGGRAFLTIFTIAITSILGMITGILTARLLGPTGRGELAAIQSWLIVFSAVANMGLSESVIYFGTKDKANTTAYLTTSYIPFSLALIITSIAGWIILPIVLHAQSDNVIFTARVVLLYLLPINGLFIAYESLRSYGSWFSWNILKLVPHILWISIIIFAFSNDALHDATKLIKIYPFVFLIQALIAILIIIKKYKPFPIKPKLEYIRPLALFGIPIMATVIPYTLNQRLDQLVMAFFLPAESLGLYVAAVAWSNATTPIFTGISQVIFPRISSLTNKEDIQKFVRKAMFLCILFSVVVNTILYLLTPTFFPLLFGQNFSNALPVASFMVFAGAVGNFNIIFSSIFRGLGKPKIPLFTEVVGLLITVSTLVLLLPTLGIMGAAVSSLFTYLGVLLIYFYCYLKLITKIE
jgi:O-antigen/teichoic acid export membrane protein